MELSSSEDRVRMIVALVVLTQSQRVTDSQTIRQTESRPIICWCAVKTLKLSLQYGIIIVALNQKSDSVNRRIATFLPNFIPIPIWNDGAVGFFEEITQHVKCVFTFLYKLIHRLVRRFSVAFKRLGYTWYKRTMRNVYIRSCKDQPFRRDAITSDAAVGMIVSVTW